MHYNLITEKFISAVFVDGTSGVLNLKETLARAPQILYLTYDYPVKAELYSMYRFLVQLVADIFRPANEEDIYDLFETGQFDMGKVDAYFDTNYSRFDLFDSQHPFMQATEKDYKDFKKAANPMDIMSPLTRQGNNDIFYYPINQFQNEKDWSAQHTIYNLIFNTANHVKSGSGYKAPIMGGSGTTPLFVLYEGSNLFQTIILNMDFITDKDIPYWRRNGYGEVYDFSVMNYEFYPVMKFHLDENGFENNTFKTVHMESDNQHPVFKLGDDEFKNIKNTLMISHPGIVLKNYKQKGITVPVRADTQKEPWFSMGTLLQSRAHNDLSRRTALSIMQDEGTIPDIIYISFYGVHKGNGSAFKNLYEGRCAIAEKCVFDKDKQAEIDKLIEFIDLSGAILKIASENYAKAVIKIAPTSKVPRQYSEVAYHYFRTAKHLFFIEYLQDPNADFDAYIAKVIKLCINTFKELPTIHGDEITKREQERFLLNKLRKEQEDRYGTNESKAQ